MPGLNIGTSVLKRDERNIEEVAGKLTDDGWRQTGSALNGRIRYFQRSGINITAVGGPSGTVIMPSGPLRGFIFGDGAVTINRTSSVGFGSRETDSSRERVTSDQMV